MLAVTGFIFVILNILSGNMFAIFSIFMNGIFIGCMRKLHVKAWLNDPTP
ncbi:hypothetical protein [Nitrosopumilus cobalaminigenes]|nr:hypothetical protein [Nitrosopumilus cobalaminigenes]